MRAIVVLLVLVIVLPAAAAQLQYAQMGRVLPARTAAEPAQQPRTAAEPAQQALIPSAAIPPQPLEKQPEIKVAKKYKTKLTCPIVPKTGLRLPLPPYPKGGNDCDLVGKGADIEAFLQALEKIAATCNSRRAGAWNAVLAARKDLDSQIDALEVPPPSGKGPVSIALSVCPSYGELEPLEPAESILGEEGKYYTRWLERIEKDTIKYCRLIDELIKPLWDACDEVNFRRTCEELSDAHRQAYHKILAAKMNAANINYGYTDFFYRNTLKTFGWGDFRKQFNESAIDCQKRVMRTAQMPVLSAQVVSQAAPPVSAKLIWKVSTRGSLTGGIMMTTQGAPMVSVTQPNGTTVASPVRIGNGVLYFSEAAVGRPAACIRESTRCEDNTFIRCVGGTWEAVETCRNSEVCTPGGCRMLRWSRYPFVKITPPGRAPDESIRANLTSHEMQVQVDI